jgi:ribosomal protein S18 acetylase RimI-like enzyme
LFLVVSLTIFALLVARVLRAPRGTWRFIVAAAGLVVAGAFLLPPDNAFRQDIAASVNTLAWLGVAMIPVGIYAFVLRRLRRRTGADGPKEPPVHPRGLVRIVDDAALASDTRAALDAEAQVLTGCKQENFSLGWRAEDGRLAGHVRLRLECGLADVEMIRVNAEDRRQGIATRLWAAAEAELRAAGAERIVASVAEWQVPEFFGRQGFREVARVPMTGGRTRRIMEKVLDS